MTPDLGKYAFEVALSYAGTILLLAGIVALSVFRARSARRQLEAAEERRRDG